MTTIDPSTSTNRGRRGRGRTARALQPGPVADFFRWLIGLIVWMGSAVLLTVFVIGAWMFSPLAGLGTTVFAAIAAYFMVRER